jgi:hypothetical protein
MLAFFNRNDLMIFSIVQTLMLVIPFIFVVVYLSMTISMKNNIKTESNRKKYIEVRKSLFNSLIVLAVFATLIVGVNFAAIKGYLRF